MHIYIAYYEFKLRELRFNNIRMMESLGFELCVVLNQFTVMYSLLKDLVALRGNENTAKVNQMKIKYQDFFFLKIVVSLWNSLRDYVVLSLNVNIFKKDHNSSYNNINN